MYDFWSHTICNGCTTIHICAVANHYNCMVGDHWWYTISVASYVLQNNYKDKQLITFSVAVDSRLSFMFCMILLTCGAVIACYVLGG